jgi:hypothetical protein
MRIAVVANSVFPRDYSREIDESDVVVRFNRCESMTGNSGRKTTVLVLCNTGKSGLFFTQKHILDAIPCFADVRKIWLPRNPGVYAARKSGFRLFDRSQRVGCTDHSARIAAMMGKRGIAIFDSEIHEAVEAKLGAKDGSMPSTGILTIEFLLSRVVRAGDEIALYGFSHRGIRAHDWNCEKLLIDRYAEAGRLRRADDALPTGWCRAKGSNWTALDRLPGFGISHGAVLAYGAFLSSCL